MVALVSNWPDRVRFAASGPIRGAWEGDRFVKQYTLAELASCCAVPFAGDGSTVITDAVVIAVAGSGDLTFARDEANLSKLSSCGASAAIIPHGCELPGLPVLMADDPTRVFVDVVKLFRPAPPEYPAGISPLAHVDSSARLDNTASVQAGAVIAANVEIGPRSQIHGGVQILPGTRIGSDCVIFPNVTIYEHVVICDRVVVHAGCVLGGYGFGYDLVDGSHRLGYQLGNVIIEDDVDIGPCSTIDRGTFGPTRIGVGTKLDNHVQIAHNCHIGHHNIICALAGIAGSVTTGDYVVIGGQVGIRDHTKICAEVRVGPQSGIMQDITVPNSYLGTPAVPDQQQLKTFAIMRHLPEMRKRLRQVQRELSELKSRLDGDGLISEDAA